MPPGQTYEPPPPRRPLPLHNTEYLFQESIKAIKGALPAPIKDLREKFNAVEVEALGVFPIIESTAKNAQRFDPNPDYVSVEKVIIDRQGKF